MCSREPAPATGEPILQATASRGPVQHPATTGARYSPGALRHSSVLQAAASGAPRLPGAAVPSHGRTTPAAAAALTAVRAVHTAPQLRAAAAAPTGRVRRAAAAVPTGRVRRAAAAVLRFEAADPRGAVQDHQGEAAAVPPALQVQDDNCHE